MKKRLIRVSLWICCICILPKLGMSQIYDCDIAQIICSDSMINFTPMGGGLFDFANPNNDAACFQPANMMEENSAWYYFEFRKDMPPNSIIEFAIKSRDGFDEDYDFNVYGPNVRCDSLGSPPRCSFVDGLCDFCDEFGTGLGQGTTDTLERAWEFGDGFVAPMEVQPGEGFFLFIEYFVGTAPPGETFFNLTWDGDAAPFLNCIANPFCYNADAYAGEDTTICGGQSVQLNGLAINAFNESVISYSWTGTDGATDWLDDPFSQNPVVNIPDGFSGRVTFTLRTEEGNCEKYDEVVITVLPQPDVEITGQDFLCNESSLELTATPGLDSYLWTHNGATSNVVTITEPGIYELTVTDSICSATTDFVVFNAPIPDPIITGDPQICPGETTTLNIPNMLGTYLWNTGSTEQSIEVGTSGQYIVEVTTALGNCTVADTFDVEVLPQPIVEITGDSLLCPEELITLSIVDTFTFVSWQNNSSSSSIEINSGGLYNILVRDGNGCPAVDTFNIIALTSPEPMLDAGATICPGDSIELFGGNFAQYEWSTGLTGTDRITVKQPGTYTLRVFDDFGCVGETQTVIDTFTRPAIAISNPLFFCAGDSVEVAATAGFASYDWSNGVDLPQAVFNQEGNFTLNVIDNNGCPNEVDFFIEEKALPFPIITGDTSICGGAEAILNVTESYVRYEWSNGTIGPSLTTSLPDIFTVTVEDEFGCIGSNAVEVEVQPLPLPIIDGPTIFCPGDTVIINAQDTFVDYEWSLGLGMGTFEQMVVDEGTYSLTVTDSKGCRGETSFAIAQHPEPTPSISGDTEFCSGLTAQIGVDQTYTDYRWSNGMTGQNIEVTSGGIYTVTITNDIGCRSTASFNVIENSLPQPDIQGIESICSYEETRFILNESFSSYTWQDGSDENFFETNQAGTYWV
ncbi:MAG: hypothetical protein AAFO07_26890, partial [Bacteroidota bacterium]